MGDPKKQLKALTAASDAMVALDPDEQQTVLDLLARNFSLDNPVTRGALSRTGDSTSKPAPSPGGPAGGSPTAKAFMATKKPNSEIERITCLGYYLSHHMNTPRFKTRDITTLAKDAAQAPFSNPTVTLDNATKANLFAPAGGGQKQITARGEALVEALPDREAVTKALEEHAIRKRKSRPRKKPA